MDMKELLRIATPLAVSAVLAGLDALANADPDTERRYGTEVCRWAREFFSDWISTVMGLED